MSRHTSRATAPAESTAGPAVGRDASDEVDLAAAAVALSVHYQTAYRWVRSGLLPARVEKGAYRIGRRDIAALVSDRTTPRRTARHPRPSPAMVDRARRLVTDALVEGEERTLRTVARQAAAKTSVTRMLDEVVAPALGEIGRRWFAGSLPVWGEHRAAAMVGRLLGDVSAVRPGRPRGTAIVTTVAGDRHSLPSEMAVAALREDGWRVHHLGADVPTADIVEVCRLHRAAIVVITVTTSELAGLADEVARLVGPLGPRVLVGGPGRTLAELQRLARDPASSRLEAVSA